MLTADVDTHDLLAAPLDDLLAEARRLRAGPLVTYSPKVFVPLTTLCRDVCGYCTFARPPRRGERAYLTDDEVLAIARAGAAAARLGEQVVEGRGEEVVLSTWASTFFASRYTSIRRLSNRLTRSETPP